MSYQGLRDDIEMKNATYVSVRPPSNYYNGDLVIWPANTAVKTKCKEGKEILKEME